MFNSKKTDFIMSYISSQFKCDIFGYYHGSYFKIFTSGFIFGFCSHILITLPIVYDCVLVKWFVGCKSPDSAVIIYYFNLVSLCQIVYESLIL